MIGAKAPMQPGSRQPRPCPPLPLEILRMIAEDLDLGSAFALTLTCKALRDAGECRLYRVAVINSGPTDLLDRSGRLVETSQTPLAEMVTRIVERVNTLRTKVESHPYRATCVKVVRLEVLHLALQQSLTTDILHLLELFAPTIEFIEVRSWSDEPFKHYLANRYGWSSTCIFRALSGQGACRPLFPRLRRLHPMLPPNGQAMLPMILGRQIRFNRLEYLRLVPSNGYWSRPLVGSIKAAASRHAAKYGASPLLRLRRLEVFQAGLPSSVRLLLRNILEQTPDLEDLRLISTNSPEFTSRISSHWAQLPKRHRLVLLPVDGGLGPLWCHRYIGSSRELVIREPRLSEEDEPNPPYASAGVKCSTTRVTDFVIAETLLSHMRMVPALETILYNFDPDLIYSGGTSDGTHGLDLYSTPTPNTWEEEGCRGLLIREDTDPNKPHRPFYHVRALTRVYLNDNCENVIGFTRSWRDNARYDGKIIPDHIIRQVYETALMSRHWIEPGRNLSMCAEAWDVLDQWRITGDIEGIEWAESETESLPDFEQSGEGDSDSDGVADSGSNDASDDDDGDDTD